MKCYKVYHESSINIAISICFPLLKPNKERKWIFFTNRRKPNHVRHILPQDLSIYPPEWINVQLLSNDEINQRRPNPSSPFSTAPYQPCIPIEDSEKDKWTTGLYIELTFRESWPEEEQKRSLDFRKRDRTRGTLDRREETCFHPIVLRPFQEQWPRSRRRERLSRANAFRERERERESCAWRRTSSLPSSSFSKRKKVARAVNDYTVGKIRRRVTLNIFPLSTRWPINTHSREMYFTNGKFEREIVSLKVVFREFF